MIFDLLAGIVEKHAPEFVSLLHEAKLFGFPGRAHEILPHTITDEEVEFLREQFFLPFRVTAVEDTATCVVLVDRIPDQLGVSNLRFFIDCMPLAANNLEEFPSVKKEDRAIWEGMDFPKGACAITFGLVAMEVNSDEPKRGWRVKGQVLRIMAATKDAVLWDSNGQTEPVDPDSVIEVLRNPASAMEEVMYFNAPNRFIVEKSAVKVPKNHLKSKMVIRSHERPTYTLLTPKDARALMRLTEPGATGKHVTPHERRRHRRTLKSDKFVNKQGQTIVIPASWVGPSESVVGNKKYKILLEK